MSTSIYANRQENLKQVLAQKDIEKLNSLGVGKLFGPGTPVVETIDYITNWVNTNRR